MWRIELRAGKKHLKEQWGCKSWADLRTKLGDIYAHALLRIRYKAELWEEDENVTRIDDDQMWERCRDVVAENLFEYTSKCGPGVVKQVMQDQQRQTITAMMIGLSANLAVLPCFDIEYVNGAIAVHQNSLVLMAGWLVVYFLLALLGLVLR